MRIMNIRIGIIAMFIGLIIMITFNQNIMTIINLGTNIELQALLYGAWLITCFLIGAYLPIGATIEDTEKWTYTTHSKQ